MREKPLKMTEIRNTNEAHKMPIDSMPYIRITRRSKVDDQPKQQSALAKLLGLFRRE